MQTKKQCAASTKNSFEPVQTAGLNASPTIASDVSRSPKFPSVFLLEFSNPFHFLVENFLAIQIVGTRRRNVLETIVYVTLQHIPSDEEDDGVPPVGLKESCYFVVKKSVGPHANFSRVLRLHENFIEL